MSCIDYVHDCNKFLVSNNKNISKVNETQDKKLYNLLLRNMEKNSDTYYHDDKVIFNFSSYNLNDHEKSVLCTGLNFVTPPKAIEYSQFLLPFEMLFREITTWTLVILIKNVSKVDFAIGLTHHLSRFP